MRRCACQWWGNAKSEGIGDVLGICARGYDSMGGRRERHAIGRADLLRDVWTREITQTEMWKQTWRSTACGADTRIGKSRIAVPRKVSVHIRTPALRSRTSAKRAPQLCGETRPREPRNTARAGRAFHGMVAKSSSRTFQRISKNLIATVIMIESFAALSIFACPIVFWFRPELCAWYMRPLRVVTFVNTREIAGPHGIGPSRRPDAAVFPVYPRPTRHNATRR